MITKQKLIDLVVKQIEKDVENKDMTAVEELLRNVPDEYLYGYLPEVLVRHELMHTVLKQTQGKK